MPDSFFGWFILDLFLLERPEILRILFTINVFTHAGLHSVYSLCWWWLYIKTICKCVQIMYQMGYLIIFFVISFAILLVTLILILSLSRSSKILHPLPQYLFP